MSNISNAVSEGRQTAATIQEFVSSVKHIVLISGNFNILYLGHLPLLRFAA